MCGPVPPALLGTGWRSTTRVAAGDPALWTDILSANAGAVLAALGELAGKLESLRAALASGDEAALHALLTGAALRRAAAETVPRERALTR